MAGIDLFFELLGRAEQEGWRIYFLGAREEVVAEVVRRAREKHPRPAVAGHRDGYWKPDEEASVVDAIAATEPHILFVAISSPRKEEFLARHQRDMRVPFAMGVGGSFDVMAGITRRAPRWMQRNGLEWLYRFLQEPRRMFRRYLIEDVGFFWLLGRAMVQRAVRPRRATREA